MVTVVNGKLPLRTKWNRILKHVDSCQSGKRNKIFKGENMIFMNIIAVSNPLTLYTRTHTYYHMK